MDHRMILFSNISVFLWGHVLCAPGQGQIANDQQPIHASDWRYNTFEKCEKSLEEVADSMRIVW